MNAFWLSAVIILFVIYIIIVLDGVLKRSISYIVTSTEEFDENIEVELRKLLHENPGSGIIVIDTGKSPDTRKILRMLERDFPVLHIITR